jgi:hypothetical protein
VPDLIHVPKEGQWDIVDGIPKHEKVLHECFGGDTDPLFFHRHADPCSDPLVPLQGSSKIVAANADDAFNADKPQQPARDWPHGITLLNGEIDNLIELLIDEGRASKVFAVKCLTVEDVAGDVGGVELKTSSRFGDSAHKTNILMVAISLASKRSVIEQYERVKLPDSPCSGFNGR